MTTCTLAIAACPPLNGAVSDGDRSARTKRSRKEARFANVTREREREREASCNKHNDSEGWKGVPVPDIHLYRQSASPSAAGRGARAEKLCAPNCSPRSAAAAAVKSGDNCVTLPAAAARLQLRPPPQSPSVVKYHLRNEPRMFHISLLLRAQSPDPCQEVIMLQITGKKGDHEFNVIP